MIVVKPSNFQLMSKPRVTKNIFIMNKEFDFSGEVVLKIDDDIKILKVNDQEMSSVVILSLKFFQENDLKDVPFKLELEVEGVFEWGEELHKEELKLETLLQENAPAILYSYVRPIITNISVDANLPPLVIPLMNFRK